MFTIHVHQDFFYHDKNKGMAGYIQQEFQSEYVPMVGQTFEFEGLSEEAEIVNVTTDLKSYYFVQLELRRLPDEKWVETAFESFKRHGWTTSKELLANIPNPVVK